MRWLRFLGAAVACYLTAAWALMISVGIVHAQWLHALPLLGWYGALAVLTPLTVITGSAASFFRLEVRR